MDSSTGLVKFGTRYYNPNLGRWTQQDPVAGSLGNPDSLNRYLYAKDDPVSVVDPSGKQSANCYFTLDLQGFFIGQELAGFVTIFTAFVPGVAGTVAAAATLGGLVGGALLLSGAAAVAAFALSYAIVQSIATIQSSCSS